MSGVVIGLGNWFVHAKHLQTKADAGAIAGGGAFEFPCSAGVDAIDQRIADAVTWHKTLSKLMIEGHFSPTTFNLAFFMHNLFRDEIERENQEIQAEKKLELPKKAPEPVAAPAPVSHETREVAATVRDHTLSGTRSQFVEEKQYR